MNPNPHSSDSDPQIGSLLGSYVIEELIGCGGMGDVYRGLDRHLKRQVAIKFLKFEDHNRPEMMQRFEKEAACAAAIDNEYVVPIYSIDADESGRPYIVMAYIDGPDLSEILSRMSLTREHSLRIFGQVADALTAVHQNGLVHRDIKPANILLKNEGGANEKAMLTDFGIAKSTDSQTFLTMGPIGTPDYMAPEVADLCPATPYSDQYSLALVLYRMLAGQRLFEGHEMPRAHRDEPLPDLAPTIPTAGRAVIAALETALSKDPKDRFPSVAAFANAISRSETRASQNRAPLQAVMETLLAERGALFPSEIANLINTEPGSDKVTELQIEGRAGLFSQLFHLRPDGRLEVRDA